MITVPRPVDRPAPPPPPAADPAEPHGPRAGARSLVPVAALALLVNTWGLSLNGSGNDYYTAAARSMATSWRNWFFASFDPGGFISVDKPPGPLWVAAASVRLFGVSSWSVLLPSALAGTGAVVVLWFLVRRRFGAGAATIAGVVLALTPVSATVNRLNLPEPWMLLFLVSAVSLVERAASRVDRRRLLLLAAAGGMVGLAFNSKMLAAAIPVPAVGLGLLLQAPSWRRRMLDGLAFGVASLASSTWWIVVVDLVPSSARPYVGGSTDDTVLDLLLGYNGLGRVEGSGFGGGPGGSISGAGGVMGGSPGSLRLLSEALGGQIAWLLPLALVGAILALVAHRRHAHRRASIVTWIGWVVLYGWIFSVAGGTFHAYYTSAMAPGVAALVGIGAAALLDLSKRDPRWWLVGGVAVSATAALELRLLGRFPGFYGWARVPLLGLLALGVAIAVVDVVRRGAVGRLAPVLVGVALLLGPGAYTASELATPVLNATLPQAGPRQGTSGSTFGSASWNGDPALATFLAEVHTDETWDLVVANAQQASGLEADEGVSVMALGGFMGTDAATDLASIADWVQQGDLRLFLVSDHGRFGPGGRGVADGILDTVADVCRAVDEVDGVDVPTIDGTLYDCSAAGAELAARA